MRASKVYGALDLATVSRILQGCRGGSLAYLENLFCHARFLGKILEPLADKTETADVDKVEVLDHEGEQLIGKLGEAHITDRRETLPFVGSSWSATIGTMRMRAAAKNLVEQVCPEELCYWIWLSKMLPTMDIGRSRMGSRDAEQLLHGEAGQVIVCTTPGVRSLAFRRSSCRYLWPEWGME